MRVAVIGAGAAGMLTAYLCEPEHEVVIYEGDGRVGGHVHSVTVEAFGAEVTCELGAKFFFDPVYPTLRAVLDLLGLVPRVRAGSLTVVRKAFGEVTVLPPRSLRQAALLARSPRMLRDVSAYYRLLRSAPPIVARQDWRTTLAEHATALGLPEAFQHDFLFPLVAAHWGAPLAVAREFPAYSVLRVVSRKDLFKPALFEIAGGLGAYVDALRRALQAARIHLCTPVASLRREEGAVIVRDASGQEARFDRVVVAAPWFEAARMLEGAGPWAELGAQVARLRHFDTTIAIHTDPRFMPEDRSDWSTINVFHEPGGEPWQTEWSGISEGVPVFRTWLPRDDRRPRDLRHRRTYKHLVVTPENAHVQRAIDRLQGQHGVHLAGMYVTDVDNHESALRSAMRAAEALAPRSPRLEALREARARRELGEPRPIDRRAPRPLFEEQAA